MALPWYFMPQNKFDRPLIFAPHSDDAALSIGGLLLKYVSPPAFVVTVFGQSNYTKARPFIDPIETVTSVRRNEEENYVRAVGAELQFCMFPECPLRLGNSFDVLFRSKNNLDPKSPPELRAFMQHTIEQHLSRCVFLPLGLGNHHDHLLVRDIGMQILELRRFDVYFYEDLPYAAAYTTGEIYRAARVLSVQLVPITLALGHTLFPKLLNCSHYPSQIGLAELWTLLKYSIRAGSGFPAERIWHVPSRA